MPSFAIWHRAFNGWPCALQEQPGFAPGNEDANLKMLESETWPCAHSNAPDQEIMAFARQNDYVVLTHDLDFSAILAATHGEKPSVVQIRAEDVNPDAIVRQVIDAFRQMAFELNEGALLTIDPNRTRLRLLPLYRGWIPQALL